MRSRLIQAPVALAISLATARLALKYEADDTSLDPIITAYVQAITVDAELDTGRAFIAQKWRATGDAFPAAIRLRPPVISVEAITYLDADGIERTLDPATYIVDKVSAPGYIVPAPGRQWPATQAGAINAVNVDYTSGYGESPEQLPAQARTYILAKLVEQFDPNVAASGNVRTSYVDRLLDGLRIREFG